MRELHERRSVQKTLLIRQARIPIVKVPLWPCRALVHMAPKMRDAHSRETCMMEQPASLSHFGLGTADAGGERGKVRHKGQGRGRLAGAVVTQFNPITLFFL